MAMNHKGMTLIETIVAIFILSIASMMLLSGFSVVYQLMTKGNLIKNQSDDLYAYAQGSEQEEIINRIDDVSSSITYTITSSTSSIPVETTLHKLKLKEQGDRYLYTMDVIRTDSVKDLNEYQELDVSIRSMLTKIKSEESTVSSSESYNKITLNHEIILFPNALFPRKNISQPVYLLAYYPWEVSTFWNLTHGDLLLIGSTQHQSITKQIQGKEYIHFVYDYETYTWYYYEDDRYELTYAYVSKDRNSFYDTKNQNYIHSMQELRTNILNPSNGWKVLDINASYNIENISSCWKYVQ